MPRKFSRNLSAAKIKENKVEEFYQFGMLFKSSDYVSIIIHGDELIDCKDRCKFVSEKTYKCTYMYIIFF